MTPVELLGRRAILVPPPYFPLVRDHGVLAARSSWRALRSLFDTLVDRAFRGELTQRSAKNQLDLFAAP